MVEQLSTGTAHPTFRRSVLPGAANTRADRLKITGSQELQDFITKLGIVVEHGRIDTGKEAGMLPAAVARSNRLLDGT